MTSALRRDFVEVTTQLALIPADDARRIVSESAAGQISAAQLAVREGLLTAEQAEIVETLLSPGDAIPGYEILSLIGAGGMGAVFRARQVNLNRIVALKTVLLSRGVGPSALTRFEQEAVALARLIHPNIVSAYDFGKHAGRLFLALEYVEGEDAEKFVTRHGRVDEALVWHLIRQAAAGLAHAKSHGIVHRDIKPANLLLVAPPAGYPLPKGVPLVKIADFGLALLTADTERTRLTNEGTAVGSPNYMAPEQITASEIDHRADIYALGATAYHLLAGRAPFAGLGIAQVFAQKLSTGPQPLRDFTPTLCEESYALVERLTATKPDERFADYDELLTYLEQWTTQLSARLSGAQKIAADPTMPILSSDTLPEAPVRKSSRRTWLGLGLGAVATAVMGVVAVWRPWRAAVPVRPVGAFYRPDAYGPEIAQFDGKSLNSWQVQGEWLPDRDTDKATVLRGSRGAAEKRFTLERLPPSDGPRVFPGFRLTLLIRRHQADAVHVEFDLPPGGDRRAAHAIELAPEKFIVKPIGGKPTEVALASGDAEVQLQLVRHSRGWLVLLNEEPLCEFSALNAPPQPGEPTVERFRLKVVGGPAWFSDVSVAPSK